MALGQDEQAQLVDVQFHAIHPAIHEDGALRQFHVALGQGVDRVGNHLLDLPRHREQRGPQPIEFALELVVDVVRGHGKLLTWTDEGRL